MTDAFITFPLKKNKDPRLDCAICFRSGCEWAIIMQMGVVERVWAGLHETCRLRHESETKHKTGKFQAAKK